jgi:hypothetical protein
LTGDFLEAGSLALYQIWPGPDQIHRQLVSDDLFRLLNQVGSGHAGQLSEASSISFIGFSLAIGALLAWGILVAADRIRALAAKPLSRRSGQG